MWVNLFRAEIYKIRGHRWATGCMIWIFPAMAVIITLLALLVIALSSEARANVANDNPQWTEAMVVTWNLPNNPLGRMLLLGFTAVLFGGEYQWNTWKSTVPRSQRVPLIIVKFLAVATFVVFAFILTSILWAAGQGLVVKLAGHDYGPALSGEVLSDFAGDYALQMATTFISVIIAAGYAALAAMITRSILGSVLIGIGVTTAEGFLIIGLYLVAWLTKIEEVILLYRYTPTFSLINVVNWINEKEGAILEIPDKGNVYTSLEASLLILACWVVGLISLTAYRFYKQDITN